MPAVTNVGTRPTFGPSDTLTIEAHLLEYVGDLYGRRMDLEFLGKLRDEIRFSGPEALAAQIRRDVAQAKEFFGLD
jgi:riboflavin kinase/FMN adenylyltransferase